jgi:hypothetical protein
MGSTSRKFGTDQLRVRKEYEMDNRNWISTDLERYARGHHADLLAEAQKARLIKEALNNDQPSLLQREKVMHYQVRNVLTVLATFFSHILARVL